jgi:hypothetical protein
MGVICQFCNKEYISYSSRSNHIKKYHQSESELGQYAGQYAGQYTGQYGGKYPGKYGKYKVNNEKIVKEKEYKCRYCENIYKHKQSRFTHEQKCKNDQSDEINNILTNEKNDTISEITFTEEDVDELNTIFKENNKEYDIIKEIKKQNDELKQMIQKALKIHPKTLQKINNQLNNINTGTINNINIIQLGKENLDELLTEKEKIAILNKNGYCINELIKKVHMSDDDKFKSFKNIYITNLQNNVAYKYDEGNKKFIAVSKTELLERLIDNRMNDIEMFYKDYKDKLREFTAKQIEGFINKMNNENSKYKDEKKEEIKFLLYNGYNDIINQIKQNNPELANIFI